MILLIVAEKTVVCSKKTENMRGQFISLDHSSSCIELPCFALSVHQPVESVV